MADHTQHVPVLKEEVLNGLAIEPGFTIIDCTVGGAGHALAMIEKLEGKGRFIGLEQDPNVIPAIQEHLRPIIQKHPEMVTLIGANFVQLANKDFRLELPRVNALLADLGISSDQLADPTLGISFMVDAPLDMRLSRDRGEPTTVVSRVVRRPFKTLELLLEAISEPTAADLVNSLDERALSLLIQTYGEESQSHKIAWAIVKAREEAPITTTTRLAEVIARAIPRKPGRAGATHSATQTFQALRIVVNHELENLDLLVRALPELMAPQGRAAIITFHSLEDRIVKHLFREFSDRGIARLITPKPMEASEEEIAQNPRARSAKLRIIQFL